MVERKVSFGLDSIAWRLAIASSTGECHPTIQKGYA